MYLAPIASASNHIAQADENIKAKNDQPIKPAGLPLIQRGEQKETSRYFTAPSWLESNSVADCLRRKAAAEQVKAIQQAFQQAHQVQSQLPPDIIEGQKNDSDKQGKRQIYGGHKAVDDFVQGQSKSLSGYDTETNC
jgi:hypothetical protein